MNPARFPARFARTAGTGIIFAVCLSTAAIAQKPQADPCRQAMLYARNLDLSKHMGNDPPTTQARLFYRQALEKAQNECKPNAGSK